MYNTSFLADDTHGNVVDLAIEEKPAPLSSVINFNAKGASVFRMSANYSVYRQMSDEAVKAKTGKDWKAWITLLDKFEAKEKGHTLSAKYLREKQGLSNWWSQAVTIRYEWERGLRK